MGMTEFLKEGTILTISYWLLFAVACILAWRWVMHVTENSDAQWRRDNPPPYNLTEKEVEEHISREIAVANRRIEQILATYGVHGRDRDDILRGSNLK